LLLPRVLLPPEDGIIGDALLETGHGYLEKTASPTTAPCTTCIMHQAANSRASTATLVDVSVTPVETR